MTDVDLIMKPARWPAEDLVARYPFDVRWDLLSSRTPEVKSWLREHCPRRWAMTWSRVRFVNEDDAVFFKMVWG